MILYFIIAILSILFLFMGYIRVKYQFWARQPVFHYYDIYYWFNNAGVIEPSPPEKNKSSSNNVPIIKLVIVGLSLLLSVLLSCPSVFPRLFVFLLRNNFVEMRTNERRKEASKCKCVPSRTSNEMLLIAHSQCIWHTETETQREVKTREATFVLVLQ
jgi:hypothetical protein